MQLVSLWGGENAGWCVRHLVFLRGEGEARGGTENGGVVDVCWEWWWYFFEHDRLGGLLGVDPAVENFVVSLLGDVNIIVGWEGTRKLSLPGWSLRSGQCPCS